MRKTFSWTLVWVVAEFFWVGGGNFLADGRAVVFHSLDVFFNNRRGPLSSVLTTEAVGIFPHGGVGDGLGPIFTDEET